jgi:hypothetical protein
MKILFRQKGDLSRTENFLMKLKGYTHTLDLDKYGRDGVEALRAATPVDTGLTRDSWYYEIIEEKGQTRICFLNSNIQNGVSVAIVLQYGHASRNGGWVEGRDYINPAIAPIFDRLACEAWREVEKL